MSYHRHPIKAPKLYGTPLKIVTALFESKIFGRALKNKALHDVGFDAFRQTKVDAPLAFGPELGPVSPGQHYDLETIKDDVAAWAARTPERAQSITALAAAYQDQNTTPLDVAQKVLDFTQTSDEGPKPLRIFIAQDRDDILAQANVCAQHIQNKTPRSIFEGVPIAVKDEVDQRGYPTTVGTRFLGQQKAKEDAIVVERLRDAGALLVGKTNMHEIGIGVTGLNAHHGHCRNPYDENAHTGGSSSGSAAAVAAGLCPASVGADGGGSIRIPAALCGVVGLKPTFSRVPEHGAAPLCWSVAHLGPIARTAQDAAALYGIMAGPSSRDEQSLRAPSVDLDAANIKGKRLGVFNAWFDDADEGVVARSREALARLKEQGAEIVNIDITDLQHYALAHTVSITSEMRASRLFDDPKAFGHDVRINLALSSAFSGTDYVQAQRWRHHACTQFASLLEDVDFIMTPTTAVTAPTIAESSLTIGESDLEKLDAIMRYCRIANLTGLPAISFPVGLGEKDRPVGLMAMAKPFAERDLLELAFAHEQDFQMPRAPNAFDLLSHSTKS